jgi:superfamily II DNA or RNA helicase
VFEYIQASGSKVYYCSVGLWQEAYKFFKGVGAQFTGLIENQHYFKQPIKHTFDEFKNIVRSWNLKYEPRPYQYEAAYNILTWKSSLSELATRAGKTLLVYLVFRYGIEHMNMKRILMIVPSISLVKQGYDDFSTYGEFFNTECIWGGGKLVESANLTIGTFQSLIGFLDKTSKRYNPSFFDGYDCVCVDETHRATAAQIKTIISQPFMKSVKIKIRFLRHYIISFYYI